MYRKTLNGSSLPTVMVICVLISLLVLFAITLFDMNNLFYSNYHSMKQRKEDINSAFLLYYNDSTLLESFDEAEGYSLYNDELSATVYYRIHPWGLYESVTVCTSDNKHHSTRLVGKSRECNYEAALWVCSRDMVLSFAGDTEIKGKSFIPTNGISYIQLGDVPFSGEEIDDYFIDLSEPELPPIDTVCLKPIEQLKSLNGRNALPAKSEIKPYYSFREPTMHFELSGANDPLYLKGNVVLHADEIILSSESVLNDVILSCRKAIVEEGFTGSLQIIASDTVIIKERVQLRYPSGIYLEGNNKKTYLSLGKDSQVNGYAIIFGETEKTSGIYIEDNYHQEPTAVFRGLLYVDGIADIRGELSGAAYLKECYYLPENGVYAGTINNARISRNDRIGYPFLLARSGYQRKEIKTLH